MIEKWKALLGLDDWFFCAREILPEQVVYDDDCPKEDRYFVGINIDTTDKVGVIYHDRILTEQDVIHELLHVKFPDKSEQWINETEALLTLVQSNGI
jgi:hypothetical protein